MAKAELKTIATKLSVNDFIKSVSDEQKMTDSKKLLKIMSELSGEKAIMWGPSIIGFGKRVLKYESGRELDWFKFGFSPRKNELALYGLTGSEEKQALLKQLGKHKTGKGCLYIKKLSDIDENVLKKLIKLSE